MGFRWASRFYRNILFGYGVGAVRLSNTAKDCCCVDVFVTVAGKRRG